MLKLLKKLTYGARVFLSRRGGQEEIIDLHGRPVAMRHGGQGPPFVYLHSTLGESMRWLPFHNAWARDYTVYAPLHPGFGKSGGFDDIATIEDMAFHYIELFDALGLEEVILGGVSLGGWIAAEIAVRWPERVKSLWLSGTPGLWVEEEPLPDLFRVMRDTRAMRELLFHDPEGTMAELLFGGAPDEERMLTAFQAMTVLARLIWERPYNPRLAARLHRIKCPVLLVWGQSDKLVPPSYGQAYARCLPQATWQLLPECGHLVMFEREKEFVEAVRDFVRGK
jgi:pimeloyl-ACP methyl ester carboxylesterase